MCHKTNNYEEFIETKQKEIQLKKTLGQALRSLIDCKHGSIKPPKAEDLPQNVSELIYIELKEDAYLFDAINEYLGLVLSENPKGYTLLLKEDSKSTIDLINNMPYLGTKEIERIDLETDLIIKRS